MVEISLKEQAACYLNFLNTTLGIGNGSCDAYDGKQNAEIVTEMFILIKKHTVTMLNIVAGFSS